MARQTAIAARAWTAFHADDASQLGLAWLLLGLPAVYLGVDAACRWGTIDLPVFGRAAIALLLWIAASRLCLAPDLRIGRRHAALTILALGAAFAVMASLYDTSWDGMSYHLPAELSLAEGWNPIYGVSPVVPANWYANGVWTLRAALFDLLGTLEGSKIINAVFLLGALFTLCPALSALLQRPLTPLNLTAAYAMVANPVAVSQLPTFYVDGALYEAGLAAVAAVLLTGSAHRRIGLAILSAAIVLLTAAKITGAWYAIALPLVAMVAFRHRIPGKRAVAATLGVTLAFATIVVGFRPYVTDLRDHAQFAELMHRGAIAHPDLPAGVAGLPPPAALIYSLFARTSGAEDDAELKFPLFVSPHELKIMGTPDPFLGGFGPFFAAELIAAAAAGAFTFRIRVRGIPTLAAGVMVVSAAFPAAEFARFVPFAWMAPLLLPIAGPSPLTGLARPLCIVVVLLALGNAALALGGNLARTALGDWRTRVFMRDLAARDREILLVPLPDRAFESIIGYRLQRAGISYRVAAQAECKTLLKQERIAYCLGG
jgi:hypothetical protein